ncbi:MAG TPA: heparan-alpha-glucosaminide N-acetyltransferase domain-containing protein [Puia sp.]|nr:heparan-alpha-glucosaminide N-acetyltransferase domain-containing protein [Puia sp.]
MSTTANASTSFTTPAQTPVVKATPNPDTRSRRVESIDLLRGTVMIIMALDHARDYFHGNAYIFDPTDLTKTSGILFFTRWITHFCAPVFMFLSGVSAHLYGLKNGRKALSLFLMTRGLWLIFAELTIVSIGWTFNIHFTVYILQVIWAFGISMLVLSALLRLNRKVLLSIALVLIAGHNLLDGVHVAGNGGAAIGWAFLHEQHFFSFPPYMLAVGYPILPWIGLICLGYYLGQLYSPEQDPAKRRKALRFLGWSAISVFILLRASNLYGDPAPWSVQHSTAFTVMSFFNVTKYPPSLLYVLMTIGPALLFLSFTERPLNALTRKVTVFGRVPMFYYLVHIYLLHALAVIGAMLSGHKASDMTDLTTWVTANTQLKGYGFSLTVVYLVWIGTIVLLYPLCKWFDGYKRAHAAQKKWLSYL